MTSPNSREAYEVEDRRKFLAACGKFAAITPPAMTLLLSTPLRPRRLHTLADEARMAIAAIRGITGTGMAVGTEVQTVKKTAIADAVS